MCVREIGRDAPLHPVDDPLAAADRVLEKLVAWEVNRAASHDKYYFEALRGHIRQQAWRAIAQLFPRANSFQHSYFDDQGWEKLKQQASRLEIRWNEERQAYVAHVPNE